VTQFPAQETVYRVNIYRLEDGRWQFDHRLDLTRYDSLSTASTVANGYNTAAITDPPWPWAAVAEEIK
jgi:hypothetical protein